MEAILGWNLSLFHKKIRWGFKKLQDQLDAMDEMDLPMEMVLPAKIRLTYL